MAVPKCSECSDCKFEKYNGSPNRYRCDHPHPVKRGYKMISRCDRGSTALTVKTSLSGVQRESCNMRQIV